MFDIAFSELLLIGIVALIVIGPERLPKVARTAGTWLGKLNRYVAQVKQDIDRDMQLEELRKLQAEMKASAQKYELLAEEASQKLQQEASQVRPWRRPTAAWHCRNTRRSRRSRRRRQRMPSPRRGTAPTLRKPRAKR